MENQGKPWNQEEDIQLRQEFVDLNLKILEIAKKHQRSIIGIAARLKKLGLIEDREIDRWTDIEKENLKKEFEMGKSIEEIANIHMRSEKGVKKVLLGM